MHQNSEELSQNKKSLMNAKEPDPEALSKASYLLSHELSSDGNVSTKKPRVLEIHHIVNLHTRGGSKCFGKELSLKKSSFLGEEEEADM